MSIDARLTLALGALRLEVRLTTRSPRVALVGPSGAGKSSLLRVIAGVERGAVGTLSFAGETWQAPGRFSPPWTRRVGWVPQDARLFPHLTVRDNLAFSGAGADAVHAVADRLGVPDLLDRRPRNLSGGERQRVALGRALLASPRLLLLDEPFAALDDPLRERLSADLAQLCRERDLPCVVVSHHAADVSALADEVWRVSGGEVRPA